MSETNLKSDPAYHAGFFDAQSGEPLSPTAMPAYKAGWDAFHHCANILYGSGFERTNDGSYSKRTVLSHD